MRQWFGGSPVIVSLIASVTLAATTIAGCRATSPAPAQTGTPVMTPWGEPDLQGIWRDDYQTPLQRPARFAGREFFTEEERAELDKQRAASLGHDRRFEHGTDRDLAGSYNSVFIAQKHAGRRTSMIVDPPDGRIPPLTPEGQRKDDADRAFRMALLQSTDTCRTQDGPTCAGGKYDPKPSPKRNEPPPRYNTARINRYDGPEDHSSGNRCLATHLPPDFANVADLFIRVVQTPGGVSMFYDGAQGQGWQRSIVMNGSPHLPSNVRQWTGDSRGRWEGNSLVVDVTNFSHKLDFYGSRENLHLVERWTRLDATTLEYAITIEDQTVWTRPWTVKVELNKQSDEANRVYYEPRCHEGNFGLAGIFLGVRADERAFAAGRGPHPATLDLTKFYDDRGEDPIRDAPPLRPDASESVPRPPQETAPSSRGGSR